MAGLQTGPTRRLALLGSIVLLSGCGFRPLYAPDAMGGAGPATQGLAAVYVPVIPERSGQLLRQALQQRLDGTGSGTAKRFELVATFIVLPESVGIQQDNSATRSRLIGSGQWLLRDLSPERTVVAQGSSRVLDGFNIANQQFFAADLDQEAAIRRIAGTLADQIVVQVAAYFQGRATPA